MSAYIKIANVTYPLWEISPTTLKSMLTNFKGCSGIPQYIHITKEDGFYLFPSPKDDLTLNFLSKKDKRSWIEVNAKECINRIT